MFSKILSEFYILYRPLSTELVILLTILANFFGFFVTKSEKRHKFTSVISIVGLTFSLYFLSDVVISRETMFLFDSNYLVNKNNSIVKVIIILGVILSHFGILFMSKKDNSIHRFANFELPLLTNFSLLGMLLAISSNNLLILYLSLELQSLPSYILTAIKRDSEYSLEGGVKYFILGVFSSAVFLYGVSLIYTSLGTMNYVGITDLLTQENIIFSPLCLTGMIFVFFGLMFKIASAPLHLWIADVYQSVHGTVLKFFSVVPKVSVAYVMYVLYNDVFRGIYIQFNEDLISFFAVCSFIVGTISAIKQTNLRRMLAYSTVANSGFFLLSILGEKNHGFNGLIIYSISYLIANYGLISFSSYYWNESQDDKNYLISDLAGLGKRKPVISIAVSALLFSIAGIPPFIGFFGKFYVLFGSISTMHNALSLLAVISSVVSLTYYIGIIKVIYFSESTIPLLECVETRGYGGLTIIYGALSIITMFALNYFMYFLM